MVKCCLCNQNRIGWLLKTKIGKGNSLHNYDILIMEQICQVCTKSFEYNERMIIYNILSKYKEKYVIRDDFELFYSIKDFEDEIPDLKMALK